MEVKINREIRNYTESIFFGLSMRQFLCSILAIAVAVGLYFLLQGRLGTEALSLACMLGATPFAVMGFVSYNGMPAEKLLLAFLKCRLLYPQTLTYQPNNLYHKALLGHLQQIHKEDEHNDQTSQHDPCTRQRVV